MVEIKNNGKDMDSLDEDFSGDWFSMIPIGTTSRAADLARVQEAVCGLGSLAARLKVVNLTSFRMLDREGRHRMPARMAMYSKGVDSAEERCSRQAMRRALTHADLWRDCPVNQNITSEMLICYRWEDETTTAVDENQPRRYSRVLKYGEAKEAGLIAPDRGLPAWETDIDREPAYGDEFREPTVLGLWDRVSGLVMPLPSDSVLCCRIWDFGFGIDLYVMDGKSLMVQRHLHPECFFNADGGMDVRGQIAFFELELDHLLEQYPSLHISYGAHGDSDASEPLPQAPCCDFRYGGCRNAAEYRISSDLLGRTERFCPLHFLQQLRFTLDAIRANRPLQNERFGVAAGKWSKDTESEPACAAAAAEQQSLKPREPERRVLSH